MPLEKITASAHPGGNRIDLRWEIPAVADFTGVRVVRGEGGYPNSPDDGVIIAQGSDLESASDSDLLALQTYYYMLFPYKGSPPEYEILRDNRVSAMPTAPEGYDKYMYGLLPLIYHRYDRDTEVLKRLMQLLGGELDQLHSYARALKDFQDPEKVNDKILPLLAAWIGWKTDYTSELSVQRNEIRQAPSIYKRIGIIPTLESIVKRHSRWNSRSKEFVDNIFSSNRPARLNLWSKIRATGRSWTGTATLLSNDYAYEGRPACAVDDKGIRWIFYHTRRKGHWEIWAKTSPTVELDLAFEVLLVNGSIMPALIQAMTQAGLDVDTTGIVSTISPDQVWQIDSSGERFILEKQYDHLLAYHVTASLPSMAGSQPVVVSTGNIYKYPSAALQQQTLWLFWSVYHVITKRWQIQYRQRTGVDWGVIAPSQSDPITDNPFVEGGVYDSQSQRRQPFSLSDGSGRLWLFWLENNGAGWRLRYNRRDPAGWGAPVDLPAAGVNSFSEHDFCVLIQPELPNQKIFVFWSRRALVPSAGAFRWEIAYRVKTDLDLNDLNWSGVNTLPKATTSDNHHDLEPLAILQGSNVELYWSSDRDTAGWSIWRSILLDETTNSWDPANTERVSDEHHWQRDSFAITSASETWLVFRNNQGIRYQSELYRTTTTIDQRYAGSTTIDTRHQLKISQQKTYDDILSYVYDNGSNGVRNNENKIARDTIGVFLDNDTQNNLHIEAGVNRLKQIVEEYIPVTDRVVFIPSRELHTEFLYTYGQALSSNSKYISTSYQDELNGELVNSVFSAGEGFTDSLEPL